MTPSPPGWSKDANWFWDGLKWNDAVSPDGKYRFDGREWRKFHGIRSLMPPEPLHPIAAEGRPPAPPGPPAAQLPTWVDQSEVERLEKEKRDQETFAAHAALPQIPLPPESDWRRVGEHMQFSHQRRAESFWQVGGTSIVIFLVLFLFCSPAALIFTWLTAWKLDSKVIVTLLLLAPGVIYLILILTGTVPPPTPR